MSVNILPDMDEPRLKALGKQLNRNRKSSLIGISKDKQNLDVYVKSLNKEQRSLNGKYSVKGLRLKKSLANVRGTQKVLKSRRDQSFWEDTDEYPYGVYEGESLDSYRRQIDNVIHEKHPKLRRMRKVENHLMDGRATGKILDNGEAKAQFKEIVEKGRPKRTVTHKTPLTRTFLRHTCQYARTKAMDNLWKNPNAKSQFRMKPVYGAEDSEDDENATPIELKLPGGKYKGIARLYSPKTSRSTDAEGDTPIERKLKRRLKAYPKSPISNDSPYTQASTGYNDDDHVTVKSSPSKLNLPPLTVSKISVKTSNSLSPRTNNDEATNWGIRRVTKGDIGHVFSMENLQKLEKLKTRRITTFL